ncbi:phage tail protein [Hafnia paralvei]|uniref:phage tail protein n=1 Tax=Hafnia paralvei TaxID=546367 RepID=UPI001D0F3DAC|nr:phage tail protein [Hafnia paralvei]
MANFYSIITNRGKELEAEALASGTKITLAKFVVGDGNGQAVAPKPTQTKLINEQYRGDIGELSVSPDQPTQMMAKVVLPTEVGGFTVREIGMLTDAGELYAVANCAAIEKPVGSVSVNMQFRLAVSDTANITLNVSTGDGLFLRIDQDLSEIRGRGALAQKAARESLAIVDASTKQKGLVQLNSATNSTSDTQAATPAAVKEANDNAKTANDNANTRLEKDKNLSDVSDKGEARKNLELGSAATLNAQKTVTDTTDGAVLVVGKSFGLGFGNVVNPRPNPSTFPPSGFYTASADDIGLTQLPGGYVGLITALGGTAYRNEIALEKAGRMFIRGADGPNVPSKNWYECYTENHKPTASEVGALPSDGNAVSASKLKNARNIAGIAFDGTKDIAISAADVGTYTINEIDNKLELKGNKSTANLSTSGWWRDGSTGLLIQWGTQRSVGADGISFNYPIAFNAVYGGLATIKSNLAVDGNNAAYFFTPNLTTGTVVNDPVTTGRLCDIFWLAFGA